jgi:hypothetical protein
MRQAKQYDLVFRGFLFDPRRHLERENSQFVNKSLRINVLPSKGIDQLVIRVLGARSKSGDPGLVARS